MINRESAYERSQRTGFMGGNGARHSFDLTNPAAPAPQDAGNDDNDEAGADSTADDFTELVIRPNPDTPGAFTAECHYDDGKVENHDLASPEELVTFVTEKTAGEEQDDGQQPEEEGAQQAA